MIPVIIIFLLTNTAQAMIGYDCGSRSLNVTTLSLINVGECEIPQQQVNISQRYIQLLQLNEFNDVKVIQCKLEIHRTITKCGMFSHASVVNHGVHEYVYEISEQACINAHLTGVLKLSENQLIHGLKINSTSTHSLTFAGKVNMEGTCEGTSYADPYGSWDNVIVQGTLRVTLTSYVARISLTNDKIHLRSGVTCTFSENNCLDREGGYTFWKTVAIDSCKFDQYGILYEGYANKMVDETADDAQIVYSLTTQDITFALNTKSKESVCGYTIIRTEHPKLFIFETVKGDTFALNKKVSISNLDIFAYVNSKFVYVEKHVKAQLKQLYLDVVTQRCNLERQTLKNALAIATQSPDEFAYHLMKSPGYMAVVAGEVVHIVKCIPVEVRIKPADECYTELPVEWKNETYYLTPRTHILKKRGVQIPCNVFLPSYFSIGDTWYKILPRPTETFAPTVIKPLTRATWKYTSPENLASTGIYSERDLKDLRDMIMFPVEKPALLNNLAREMHGQPLHIKDAAILKLLNEDALEHITNSAWQRMWQKFITFGTVSAGIIALIMILQFFKLVVDILIRGYTLHSVFGWSFYIVGAIFSSVSQFLLVRLQREPPPTSNSSESVGPELYPQLPNSNTTSTIQQKNYSEENPTAPEPSKRYDFQLQP